MSYLVLQKSSAGLVYAYQTTAHWDPEKRRSVQSRIYLGRFDPSRSMIIPGRKRGEDMPGGNAVHVDKIKKVLKDGGDVAGLFSAAPEKPSAKVVATPGVLRVSEPGCFHLVRELSRSVGLEQVLEEVLGESVAQQLLLLAAYQITEAGPLYLARPWMERVFASPALKEAGFGSDGKLLERLGGDTSLRMNFFTRWMARRQHPKVLIYDLTSISTYSALLDIAEVGYNRDRENLPQINLASVHDRDSGLPLFYRVTPGSVADTATLKITGELMRELGLKDFHFVLDRGFCSQANMADMLRNNVGFTMAVPLSSRQALSFVKTRRHQLAQPKNAFAWKGSSMQHMKGSWNVYLEEKKGDSICHAHLYQDTPRKAQEETRLLNRIIRIEERAGRGNFSSRADASAWINANAEGLKNYLTIKNRGDGSFVISRKNHALAMRCATMGLTLIVTTHGEAGCEEILSEYRSRDEIEKAFDIFKNENGQNRMHISTREQAEGRMFLAFIALILSCELDQRMRHAELYKQYTTAEILAELGKIRALHFTDGSTHLLEITRTQRTLLEKLKVPTISGNIVIK